jgi:hypothetical protein
MKIYQKIYILEGFTACIGTRSRSGAAAGERRQRA